MQSCKTLTKDIDIHSNFLLASDFSKILLELTSVQRLLCIYKARLAIFVDSLYKVKTVCSFKLIKKVKAKGGIYELIVNVDIYIASNHSFSLYDRSQDVLVNVS